MIVMDQDALDAIADAEEINPGDKVEIPFTVEPEDTTDSDEEILEAVKAMFNEEYADVTVEYKDGEGKVTIEYKKAGPTYVVVYAGEEADEEEVERLNEILQRYEDYLATGELPDWWWEDYLDPSELTEEEMAEEKEYFEEGFKYFIEGMAEDGIYIIRANVTDPIPEPEPEAPDTGDMPVALMGAIMLASVAGITVSKKILVK